MARVAAPPGEGAVQTVGANPYSVTTAEMNVRAAAQL